MSESDVMNDDKIEKLAALLQEALPSVVIERRFQHSLPMQSLSEYQRNLLHIRQFCDPNLRMYTSLFEPYVEDANVQREIIDVIRTELTEYTHEDKIQSASFEVHGGGPVPGFHLNAVLSHLLKITIVRGERHAAHAFYDCIKRSHAPYQTIGLLNGVRVEEEVTVCDGIRLVPLPDSAYELPPYLNKALSVDKEHFLRRVVIIVEQSVSPQFIDPRFFESLHGERKDPFKSSVACKEFPQFNLYEFCDVLSLVCDAPIDCQALWTYMDEDDVVNVNTGVTSVGGSVQAESRTPVVVSASKIRETVSLYRSQNNLEPVVAKKIDIPLNRWMKSKLDSSSDTALVDSFIDISIALESLYLDDIDGSGEFRFRFSLRAAWFLENNQENRHSLFKEFRSIYDRRSEAVHTGKISLPWPSSLEALERAQQLCRQSIIKIIKDGGFPDWHDLVLGNS